MNNGNSPFTRTAALSTTSSICDLASFSLNTKFWCSFDELERDVQLNSFYLLNSSTDESQRDFSFGHASHSQRCSLHNSVSIDWTTRVSDEA